MREFVRVSERQEKRRVRKLTKRETRFVGPLNVASFRGAPALHRSPGFLLRGGSRELFEFVTVARLPRYIALVKSLERPSFHVAGSRGPKPRKCKNVIEIRIS